MNFQLDEDTILLRDSVRELAKQKAEVVAGWDSARALPEEWLGELGEMGLLAMQVPEEQGGAGLSTLASLAVLEELGALCASTALTVAVHNLLGLGLGADAAGGILGFARGLEAAGHGEGYRVSGTDPAVFGATTAAGFVVLATVDGAVVPLHVRRADLTAERSRTLGLRAADIGAVAFTNAPATRLPGDVARAWTDFRLALGFIAVGIGRAALAEGVGYAQEREQFGKPIAKFQAIQWKLADLATGLDAAMLMLGTAATRGEGRDAAAARASLVAVQAVTTGCSDMLQVHGGYGYTEEYAIERHYRDARAVALYAGIRDEARAAVAEGIVARYT